MKHVKDFFLNRLGWLFILANAVLLVWGMYEKGFGDRNFHLVWEPRAIQLFVLLNFPAVFVSETILDITANRSPVVSSAMQIDNLTFFSALAWACLQWLLLGWLLSRSNGVRKEKALFQQNR